MRLADLKPAPYNPRQITTEARDGLRSSLSRFGLVQPIVYNKRSGFIVGGHQRAEALREAGETQAQVLVVDLPPAEEKALNVTLNNPYVEGAFTPGLQELLADLRDQDPIAFSDLRLKELLEEAAEEGAPADIDNIPSAPKKAITKPNDLWILGDHRLLCGDSTKEENIRRLFKSDRAACVFTDPPYGVSYEDKGGQFGMIKNDDLRDDGLVKLLQPALRLAVKFSADDAGFYIWHASATRDDFSYAMKAAGLVERQYLIWAKNGFSMSWSDYKWAHEPCFYASKAERKPAFYGDPTNNTIWRVSSKTNGGGATTLGSGIVLIDGEGNKLFIQGKSPENKKIRTTRVAAGDKIAIAAADAAGTVWEISRETDMQHPTQKPAELAIRAIKNSSKENDVIYDPFLGSGTTLLGAEYAGRRCFGCELDPKYADVIIERWEDFSAKKATLEKI